jgi:hypothetical protein
MNNFVVCSTKEEAYKYASYYGNTFFTITREDIEALLAGKILAGDVADEYGIFIKMEE